MHFEEKFKLHSYMLPTKFECCYLFPAHDTYMHRAVSVPYFFITGHMLEITDNEARKKMKYLPLPERFTLGQLTQSN